MKPFSEFGANKNGQRGLNPTCRSCRSEIGKEQREVTPVRIADLPPDRAEAIRRSRRNGKLQSTYGVSIEDFEAMIAEQHGCCFICKKPPPGTTVLQMDHCHDSGVPRRPLCTNCNTGLGRFGDDVDLMLAAVAYLRSFL